MDYDDIDNSCCSSFFGRRTKQTGILLLPALRAGIVPALNQWQKEDQILKIKTKTTGSKQRHLGDLTFK